jgi:hypothetical protein
MSVETITPPDTEIIQTPEEVEAPPAFGRCPVCKKPLRPRDLITGEPKAPPVGQGKLSRAICTGCGNIIEYIGGGKWKLVNPN